MKKIFLLFLLIVISVLQSCQDKDKCEGTYLASHTIMNGTIKGSPEAELGDFRACPRGTFQNIFFFDFVDPALAGRGDLSISNPTNSTCSTDNLANGVLTFSNLQAILPLNVTLTSVFKNGTSAFATSVTTRTVGANKSSFSWTWAEQANVLLGL